MADIDLEVVNTHHWKFTFDVLLDKEKAQVDDKTLLDSLEATDFWITDEVVVAGVQDASKSIQQVKDWVMNTDNQDDYPLPIIGFRLTGIELLSEAEI